MHLVLTINIVILCQKLLASSQNLSILEIFGGIMSSSPTMSIDDIVKLVDEVARKGLPYAIGVFVFFRSLEDEAFSNTFSTLKEGFGEEIARTVITEVRSRFSGIYRYARVVVEGKEVEVGDFISDYTYRKYISPVILAETRKRLSSAPSNEMKYLAVASSIIMFLWRGKRIGYGVSVYSDYGNSICVSSSDIDNFTKAVSTVLKEDLSDVRRFFFKYLLGYSHNSASRRHNYYDLCIYPNVIQEVESLAAKASDYVKTPNRLQVSSILREMYDKEEYVKTSVVNLVTECGYGSEYCYDKINYLSAFFGLPRDILCRESSIEGVLWNCMPNPFVYEDVVEELKILEENAVKSLGQEVSKLFVKQGYKSVCTGNKCVFTKEGSKPIVTILLPWPKPPSIWLYNIPQGSIVLLVTKGTPSETVLEWINSLPQYDSSKYALWLFLQNSKLFVAANTYNHAIHSEVLKILAQDYEVKFIGQPPQEAVQLLQQLRTAKAFEAPVARAVAEARDFESRLLLSKPSRDVLESIVAKVLEDFGFKVDVDVLLPAKGGNIEVDVWGVRNVEGMEFRVYVSCKNWRDVVGRSVVDQEFGRVLQLMKIPHLRILVARELTDDARRAALDDGFFVIELGEKTSAENAKEIYELVSGKLKKLFTGIAPQKLRDVAEKLKQLAKEIEEIT